MSCTCEVKRVKVGVKKEDFFILHYCPMHKAAPALVEACEAMLPVIQYILENGWDEAPPLFGTTFDETKANELAIQALALAGKPTPTERRAE